MRVLITGGMGFIGLHAAKAFLDGGDEVVVTQFRIRREPTFVREALGNRLQREVADITSPYVLDDLLERHGIDQILHLAVPGIGALSAAEDYRSNIDGLLHVLEGARRKRVKRVVVASSVVVYSGTPGPWSEQQPLPVTSPNATSAFKKAAEILGSHYADRTALDVVFARIAYVYGPLYHSMRNGPSRLTHAAVRALLDDGGGDPHGGDYYDYCYVTDCAQALRLLQHAPLAERSYNIGGGRATSNDEVAAAVRAAVPGSHARVQAGRRPGAGGPNDYLDLTRMTAETGYRPQFDMTAGILDYAAWLRANEE